MRRMMLLAVLPLAGVLAYGGTASAEPAKAVRETSPRSPKVTVPSPSAERPGNCQAIKDEIRRQGGSAYVAERLGGFIANRESGCYPRQVHDRDDWSYSRFGLNGLTAGLRATWRAWCGADVRSDTRVLSVDVRCALAAYRHMGWQPWAVR